MSRLTTCTASPLFGAGKIIRLIPAGIFRATDGRPAGLPGWKLTASNAAAIIQAATLRANDFLIDYEHQTISASKNGLPAPAAGWFKRLEWRNGDSGGLFALDVRWTERAAAMIAAREYRYISPVFTFDFKTGDVQGLHSAAITNDPALDGLTDMVAAKSGFQRSVMSKYDRDHANRVLLSCFGVNASLIPPVDVGVNDALVYSGTAQQKEHDNYVMRRMFGEDAPQIK
ncbi:MAG: phage protease [Gallionella sp.]|nr:phage protease [Gallionella sp.]